MIWHQSRSLPRSTALCQLDKGRSMCHRPQHLLTCTGRTGTCSSWGRLGTAGLCSVTGACVCYCKCRWQQYRRRWRRWGSVGAAACISLSTALHRQRSHRPVSHRSRHLHRLGRCLRSLHLAKGYQALWPPALAQVCCGLLPTPTLTPSFC